MKKTIRLNESELHRLIHESVKRILNESYEDTDFYAEEDSNGNTGEPGQVKSYEIEYYTTEQAKQDAQENGFNDVGKYLKYWFEETYPHEFIWQTLKNSYSFNGETLYEDETGLVIKDIYGQIMFDGYEPNSRKYSNDFSNRLNRGEYWSR